jgi:protein ImuB
MSSRLGPEVISRIKFVDTHIPERAMVLEPAVARTPDNPRAMPEAALPRPLRLLPAPEPIEALLAEVPDGPPRGMIWRRVRYRFLKARGPERIAAEWWQHAGSLEASRSVASHKPERSSRDDAAPNRAPRPAASGLPSADAGLPPFAAAVVTRDYFLAEDDGGRRFWLFREGFYGEASLPRWFLHGFFA